METEYSMSRDMHGIAHETCWRIGYCCVYNLIPAHIVIFISHLLYARKKKTRELCEFTFDCLILSSKYINRLL